MYDIFTYMKTHQNYTANKKNEGLNGDIYKSSLNIKLRKKQILWIEI